MVKILIILFTILSVYLLHEGDGIGFYGNLIIANIWVVYLRIIEFNKNKN